MVKCLPGCGLDVLIGENFPAALVKLVRQRGPRLLARGLQGPQAAALTDPNGHGKGPGGFNLPFDCFRFQAEYPVGFLCGSGFQQIAYQQKSLVRRLRRDAV